MTQCCRRIVGSYYITIEDQFSEGDKSVVRWTAHGTHQGALQGRVPTGKQVTVTAVSIFRWANGMAEEVWTIYDQLSLLQQLGLNYFVCYCSR